MPIPPFTDEGLLPAGLYAATLDEVLARFGTATVTRRVIGESLGWAVGAARRAGIARFVIDGSFIDDCAEPNDVDCAVLLEAGFPRDQGAARELEEGFPYVQMLFFEQDGEFEAFVRMQFGTDRRGRPRGLVEVTL